MGLLIGRLYEPKYNVELTLSSQSEAYNYDIDRKTHDVELRDRPNSDTLIWVALSGGGTRAAATAWKTLEELKKIPFLVTRDGQRTCSNIADEIDYISGISGGCFAAVAWPIFRDQPEKFRKYFLEENIERRLLSELFTPPWRLFMLTSSKYDRINVAAEFYDREIFDGKTFSDLPLRPELRVHV